MSERMASEMSVLNCLDRTASVNASVSVCPCVNSCQQRPQEHKQHGSLDGHDDRPK